jgi:glycosyltransferase involved in cell wall biosynthesis
VASAVGGIKEVVVHGETGYQVPLEQMLESPFEPVNPDQFSRDLATRLNELMANPDKRKRFGRAGRELVINKFSWAAIAMQTKALYEEIGRKIKPPGSSPAK